MDCAVPESKKYAKKLRYDPQWIAENLVTQYPDYVKPLCDLEGHELQNFLREKRERFPQSTIRKLSERSIDTETMPLHQTSLESIVNTLCHPDVINKAAELLLTTCTSDKR